MRQAAAIAEEARAVTFDASAASVETSCESCNKRAYTATNASESAPDVLSHISSIVLWYFTGRGLSFSELSPAYSCKLLERLVAIMEDSERRAKVNHRAIPAVSDL